MLREHVQKKISDKIGETGFGKTRIGDALTTVLDEEKQTLRAAAQMDSFVRDMEQRRNRIRAVLICAVGNILIWLAVIFLPRPVNYAVLVAGLVFTKGGTVFLALPFGFGTLGTYAVLRNWFPGLESQKPSDLGVMSSYQYQSESSKIWGIWMASCIVGVTNSLLIFFAFMGITSQLNVTLN